MVEVHWSKNFKLIYISYKTEIKKSQSDVVNIMSAYFNLRILCLLKCLCKNND